MAHVGLLVKLHRKHSLYHEKCFYYLQGGFPLFSRIRSDIFPEIFWWKCRSLFAPDVIWNSPPLPLSSVEHCSIFQLIVLVLAWRSTLLALVGLSAACLLREPGGESPQKVRRLSLGRLRHELPLEIGKQLTTGPASSRLHVTWPCLVGPVSKLPQHN